MDGVLCLPGGGPVAGVSDCGSPSMLGVQSGKSPSNPLRKQFTEELCFLLLFILFILIILVSCWLFVTCLLVVCCLFVVCLLGRGVVDVVNPVVQESCDRSPACWLERGQTPTGEMFLRSAVLLMRQAAATVVADEGLAVDREPAIPTELASFGAEPKSEEVSSDGSDFPLETRTLTAPLTQVHERLSESILMCNTD